MKVLSPCACGAMLLASANFSHAQTITVFQTGFEAAEGYVPGNLNGQNGWFAYIGEDPNFGEIVTTNALAGSQSVLLDCQDVLLGSFGNYAAVGRFVSIAPAIAGVPLRYIEVTGRAAIFDPTLVGTHLSNVWLTQYNGDEMNLGGVAVGSHFGQHVFGWPIGGGNPNPHVLVTPSVGFNFRHVLDYQTGLASAWKDGNPVYQYFDQNGLQLNLITTEFYFEGVAGGNQPFDTRAWYDDIRMRAIYGCTADTNGDLEVNVSDLLAVIGAWGACPPPASACPADVAPPAGDGTVNVSDLLAIIGGWGQCP